jgi:hypothetical protein
VALGSEVLIEYMAEQVLFGPQERAGYVTGFLGYSVRFIPPEKKNELIWTP